MKALRLSFLLIVAAIFWFQNAAGQHPAVPKLTQVQVEQLVSNKVPDSTLSTQIQRRGLAFAPSQAVLDSLRAKGAGPLTLGAIEALIRRDESSRVGVQHAAGPVQRSFGHVE